MSAANPEDFSNPFQSTGDAPSLTDLYPTSAVSAWWNNHIGTAIEQKAMLESKIIDKYFKPNKEVYKISKDYNDYYEDHIYRINKKAEYEDACDDYYDPKYSDWGKEVREYIESVREKKTPEELAREKKEREEAEVLAKKMELQGLRIELAQLQLKIKAVEDEHRKQAGQPEELRRLDLTL